MLSRNEWDPLETVIVGIADDSRIPDVDISLRTINYADKTDLSEIRSGLYPRQVIDEANEDLEILCDFLKKENVTVLRPNNEIVPKYYNYCPRDSVLVHKDLILATPQPLRARHDEYLSMDQHLKPFADRGARYIAKKAKKNDDLYNLNCLGDRNILALTEIEPAFDAANIIRDNDNLYYLVSNGGNEAGARYLQELVGDSTKVWPIKNIYSFMHIDSTIALLREGLMLLNPSRIKSLDQLPIPLRNWEVIWAPEPIEIGHYPGYCGSSPWLNINLLSIKPDLVVLEEKQHNLRKELEKKGIDCAMLPGRQQRTLSGGFHCVTLDLQRKH